MFKNILTSIDGVAIYPIISLVIFFIFFVSMTLYVIRQKRSHTEKMAALPLDED